MRRYGRVEVVANVASGSVAEDAPAEIAQILKDFGLEANVCAPHTRDLSRCIKDAVDRKPDLLITLAGDGTARAAAELCGLDGPVLAALPGGTMNMLPYALYGKRSWPDALSAALADGEEQILGGGAIDGHRFLVAAILGAPALWAPAREAARMKRPGLALLRARRAVRRAFTGRLRFSRDGAPREKAEALVFMCPLTSRALDDQEAALECAAFDPSGALEAFRLGINAMLGDWRRDPAVVVERTRATRVWAASGIPAILDGESVQLKSLAEVTYNPKVARVLMLPKELRT